MILINLLPHREEKRKRRKAAFFLGLGVAAAAGIVAVGLWYAVLQQLTAAQVERNTFLRDAIAKLELEIKDIATLRAQIDSLKARQKAVEDLQTDRNIPVHVLNELVKQTPEGIYFTTVKQDGQVLTLSGIAQTNERVSELLRNTSKRSEWLSKPELIEVKSANVQTADKEQKRLYDFSMRVSIKRPEVVDPNAIPSAASQPMSAASAAAPKKP
ncbi:MAG: hypothetical protein RLZZ618_997 [Pseudomonadota bacterium]